MSIEKDVYEPAAVEPKWQRIWEETRIFRADDDSAKEKFYLLEMFPYPSGDLHVGHMKNYFIGDVLGRYKMMRGFEVMHPIGWDSFGLPAENAAIKHGLSPRTWTEGNIANSKKTFQNAGIGYDWAREIAAYQPAYYKWTQWLFLKLYERGLAYRAAGPTNYCPRCATVLANEQVEEGACYRCGSAVERRHLVQWFFRITAYADRLLEDLKLIEGSWPKHVVTLQRNWIGRSEGLNIRFDVVGAADTHFDVYTTRPDTLFGVTFLALAPEHPALPGLIKDAPNRNEIEVFRKAAVNRKEIERSSTAVEKAGVFTGRYARNAASGADVPIWIGDYVLATYGEGAVMGVPAHDQRDFLFARKYGLPVVAVIRPVDGVLQPAETADQAFEDYGVMENSGAYNGLSSQAGTAALAAGAEKAGWGKRAVNYHLHDWLISRQRYWGAPIPIIHCPACGEVPVPYNQLPVLLPPEDQVDFTPSERSPLASCAAFLKTTCPKCGGSAERDADTMDTYVDSSWYFLRYCDPHNDRAPWDKEAIKRWMPVDQYVGGDEHAVSHLLYARFFMKVLQDAALVKDPEPFPTLFNQGMVKARVEKADGTVSVEVMSKSKGNAVPAGPFIEKHGADVARLYITFAGPPGKDMEWTDEGVDAMARWLNRVWRLVLANVGAIRPFADKADDFRGSIFREGWEPYDAGVVAKTDYDALKETDTLTREELIAFGHHTLKRVTDDLERLHFNTCIAFLMDYVNKLYGYKAAGGAELGYALYLLVKMLAPFAPHAAEELWERVCAAPAAHGVSTKDGFKLFDNVDAVLIRRFVIQVNGKVRGSVDVAEPFTEERVVAAARADAKVARFLEGKEIKKTVFVPAGKVLNVVVA